MKTILHVYFTKNIEKMHETTIIFQMHDPENHENYALKNRKLTHCFVDEVYLESGKKFTYENTLHLGKMIQTSGKPADSTHSSLENKNEIWLVTSSEKGFSGLSY